MVWTAGAALSPVSARLVVSGVSDGVLAMDAYLFEEAARAAHRERAPARELAADGG